MTVSAAPVTVVILTRNEARNLQACLDSVRDWVQAVQVVDSGSTDTTVAIAEAAGVRVVTHPFDTHTRQWRWALETLPIVTEWVLALDADQCVTAELRTSMIAALGGPQSNAVAGYFVNRRQIFRGRWIRHGGYYPKYLLKLFRRRAVSLDDRDLVDHHFSVSGATSRLTGDLIEDNHNEAAIADWTAKHNRYAVLQARQELFARRGGPRLPISSIFGHPDARTQWLKEQWARLPLFARPCLYVCYRYVLRAGFLDGREGFVFHVLQGFWYRLLVDVNISEQMGATAGETAPVEPPLHATAQHDVGKS
ncbi:MAG: glycosyltransferase family 2 protein [Acidobacteriota bacterium]